MIEALVALLGAQHVLTELEDILPYGFDGTAVLKQRPRAVVFPGSVQEVAEIVKLARAHRVPIVARGSGTGLSGGSVPRADSLVVCLNRFDRILELDAKNLTLRAECGVI
ncbi:MAG: FAD-binding protein, partial [Oleiharenicola lentus]